MGTRQEEVPESPSDDFAKLYLCKSRDKSRRNAVPTLWAVDRSLLRGEATTTQLQCGDCLTKIKPKEELAITGICGNAQIFFLVIVECAYGCAGDWMNSLAYSCPLICLPGPSFLQGKQGGVCGYFQNLQTMGVRRYGQSFGRQLLPVEVFLKLAGAVCRGHGQPESLCSTSGLSRSAGQGHCCVGMPARQSWLLCTAAQGSLQALLQAAAGKLQARELKHCLVSGL
ncbi:hypothetical protein Anapl_01517 [Anas platyrhynchos]|uniref:Uncharacterized protein n=1 Tax=Anas platyrhynchos TaxID=8839 RepID=R0LN43_ANAPL|nr:hypothetical protein Anapl_01517 [Anas platyrhynchos]